MAADRITIIGSGRMGQGLGRALADAGYVVTLVGRRDRKIPPALSLHTGDWPPVTRPCDVLLLATPDDVVEAVAKRLSDENGVGSDQVVMHLSGLLDHSALDALRPSGAALGSFHPLKSVAEPDADTAPGFARAGVGIEGDKRAVAAAEEMARRLEMIPLLLPPGSKPAYHAAAVLVSNYTVALVHMAERIVHQAGLQNESGMFQRLLEGTVANIAERTPRAALTGPIRRGDAHTVEAHLESLSKADQTVYRALGLQALHIAEVDGLPPETVERLRAVLTAGDGSSLS
jgi:predicted short-subunit dehydrogenase-like oxidoreductase (DUF2520 family)